MKNDKQPRVLSAFARGVDPNGMSLASIVDRFSEDELAAARRLARLNGHRHDLIGIDPGNAGWRFIRDAVVALGGKDPGRGPYQQSNRRAAPRAGNTMEPRR